MSVRSVVLKMFDRTVCPKCGGHKNQLTHIVHDEFEMRPCRLCKARGSINRRQRESVKWGGALKRCRLSLRRSVDEAAYLSYMEPEEVLRYEEGLVPLADWPATFLAAADLQLDREAAGHVSTT